MRVTSIALPLLGLAAIAFAAVWMATIFPGLKKIPTDWDQTIDWEGTYEVVAEREFLQELIQSPVVAQREFIGQLTANASIQKVIESPDTLRLLGAPGTQSLLATEGLGEILADPTVRGLLSGDGLTQLLSPDLIRAVLNNPAILEQLQNPALTRLLDDTAVRAALSNPTNLELLRDPATQELLAIPLVRELVTTPGALDLLRGSALQQALADPAAAQALRAEGDQVMIAILSNPLVQKLAADPATVELLFSPTAQELLASPLLAVVAARPEILQVLGDPAILQLLAIPGIVGLVTNPAVAPLLADPALITIALNPDVPALLADPLVQELLTDAEALGLVTDSRTAALLGDPATVALVTDPRTQRLLASLPNVELELLKFPVRFHRLREGRQVVENDVLSIDQQFTDTLWTPDSGRPSFSSTATLAVDRNTRQYVLGKGSEPRQGGFAFPFDVEKDKLYSIWIHEIWDAPLASYVETVERDGLKVFRFIIDEADLELAAEPKQIQKVPESLDLLADAQMTLWTEPKSGITVDVESSITYRLNNAAFGNPVVFRGNIEYSDDSIRSSADDARDARRLLFWGGVFLPWTVLGLGIVMLGVGVALVARSRSAGGASSP